MCLHTPSLSPLCEKLPSAGLYASITVCTLTLLLAHFVPSQREQPLLQLPTRIHSLTLTLNTSIIIYKNCLCMSLSDFHYPSVPGQRYMWFPVGQHPGHRVPHCGLGSHVEVAIMGKLEGQDISWMIYQNVFPYITGLRKISMRNTSHRWTQTNLYEGQQRECTKRITQTVIRFILYGDN